MNANVFNGKGDISNIEINCSVINEQLRHITPYVEFERIHVSKLSFHVSSWTNLRNSPIRLDVDHVHITIVEPFYYETDQTKRKRIRQVTIEELTQLMKDGVIPKPRQSSYNLLDRILDNLVIEIRSMHITYQPYGIFKTRRAGPWTPPTLLIQLFDTRWITVDEYGFEIQNNNNNSNHHRHHAKNQTTNKTKTPHQHHKKKDGSFYIEKRLETDYKISLIFTQSVSNRDNTSNTQNHDPSADNNTEHAEEQHDRETTIIPLISSSSSTFNGHFTNNSTLLDPRKKMNVHFIIQRRIRDGEYLAVQIDMMIPLVEVLLLQQEQPSNLSSSSSSSTSKSLSNAKKLSVLVHFITAMQFCLRKDRAFSDPLRPVGSIPKQPPLSVSTSLTDFDNEPNNNDHIVDEVDVTKVEPSIDKLGNTDDVGPLPILDLTLADGLSDSSSSSDDDNDNDDERNTERKTSTNEQAEGATENTTSGLNAPIDSATTVLAPEVKAIDEKNPVSSQSKNSASSGRPLLVFSNGMIVHDKFSFSLNIDEIQICAQYDTTSTVYPLDGDFRAKTNGVVVEMIWPIASMVSPTIISDCIDYQYIYIYIISKRDIPQNLPVLLEYKRKKESTYKHQCLRSLYTSDIGIEYDLC